MRNIFIISFFVLGSILQPLLSHGQQVEWLSWEEALERNKKEERKFIVDIYTKWCGWCKKMDTRTYQKPQIAEFINKYFYAVKFDAEQRTAIVFNNKIYKYVSGFGKRGYHELAQEIMNGRMSYPTTVFIDEDLNVIQPIPGFQDSRTLEMIMNYFAGDHHQSVPWARYEQEYSNMKNGSFGSPASLQPQVQPVKN